MAGERIGRVYEALLCHSVRGALAGTSPKRTLAWNPEMPDLMVRPDLVLSVKNTPIGFVLITRSGARRNWHQKFWRNVGEIVDIRSKYPSAAIVSVSLGTELKEELAEVLERFVDVNVFPSRPSRTTVEQWASRLEAKAPKDGDELETYVGAAFATAPASVRSVVTDVARAVANSKQLPGGSWDAPSAWLRSRRPPEAASAPTTLSLRRGLAKLLVCGPHEAVLAEVGDKLVPSRALGETLESFGWATKSIGGYRITDNELRGVLQGLTRPQLTAVLDDCMTPELRAMCADVVSPDWLAAMCDFMHQNNDRLVDPSWLGDVSLLARTKPGLGSIKVSPPPHLKGAWPFRMAMLLAKLLVGKKQGFGYEQLTADVRAILEQPTLLKGVLAKGATLEQIERAGTTDSLRRKLVDWVSGLQPAELEPWQISLASLVLARRFAAHTATARAACFRDLPAFTRRLVYEDRIAPYRYFEPLPAMIRSALTAKGIPFRVEERHVTLVSESSPSARDPGTIPVIVAGKTAVHWKSAHDSHTGDKTKELCGRGFALRFTVSDKGKLLERASINKTVLVLDGDFGPDDVRHLAAAGWDAVLMSSQMQSIGDVV